MGRDIVGNYNYHVTLLAILADNRACVRSLDNATRVEVLDESERSAYIIGSWTRFPAA
jgi:hypothetical protein